MKSNGIIKSVNWHITSKCNYHCKFCYMQNLDMSFTEISDAKNILERLRYLNIEKINLVGGEPMLYPLIYDIVKISKEMDFVVSITTNGSLLNEQKIMYMAPYIDWIGISVDSIHENIEQKLGRGFGNHISHVLDISNIIHNYGINLKINTTVTKLNYKENMTSLIAELNPARWKVFQMLHIKGQNDKSANELSITQNEFQQFITSNQDITLKYGAIPIFESCNDMLDSYFMLSPNGNIILNTNEKYTEYPIDIIEKKGLDFILNAEKYVSRGGIYTWN